MSEFEPRHWLNLAPDPIEPIEARLLPADALEIVSGEEAVQSWAVI